MQAFFKYFNCRSTKLLLRKPFFFINSYFLRIPSVAACFLKTLFCNCGRRNSGDVKIEFAKLRAFRAYVPYVPTCLRVFLSSCLKLLRACVPTCLRASNYYVPKCLKLLRAYVPSCLKLLRALNSYVPMCLRASNYYVPTYIRASNYYVPTV